MKSFDGSVLPTAAKIVDDVLICGESYVVDDVVQSISNRLILGTIVHGPETFRFIGLNIIQYDHHFADTLGIDKLQGTSNAHVTRVSRRQLTAALTPAEQKLFTSINCFVA